MTAVAVSLGSDEKENISHDDQRPRHKTTDADVDCHRFDEQVNICLDCCDADMQSLPRKYIRFVTGRFPVLINVVTSALAELCLCRAELVLSSLLSLMFHRALR